MLLKMSIKIVPVLEKASSHLNDLENEEGENTNILFLSPKTTGQNQWKREIFCKLETEETKLLVTIKSINIKHVIYMVVKEYEVLNIVYQVLEKTHGNLLFIFVHLLFSILLGNLEILAPVKNYMWFSRWFLDF